MQLPLSHFFVDGHPVGVLYLSPSSYFSWPHLELVLPDDED